MGLFGLWYLCGWITSNSTGAESENNLVAFCQSLLWSDVECTLTYQWSLPHPTVCDSAQLL